jgi:hypothetical protein
VEYADGAHEVFGNPRTSTVGPRGEISLLEQRAWVSGLKDYVYAGAGKRQGQIAWDAPLAYENLDRVIGGISILRADGSVAYYERAEAAALLGLGDAPPADPPRIADPAWYNLPRDPAVFSSQANMRKIAQALLLHANENKGRYPVDLGTVVLTQNIGAEAFVNPRDGSAPPPPEGMTREEAAAWVNANSGYVYLGARRSMSMPVDMVLAYEDPRHRRDGINLLFPDGRVEFREIRWARETIARTAAAGAVAPSSGAAAGPVAARLAPRPIAPRPVAARRAGELWRELSGDTGDIAV